MLCCRVSPAWYSRQSKVSSQVSRSVRGRPSGATVKRGASAARTTSAGGGPSLASTKSCGNDSTTRAPGPVSKERACKRTEERTYPILGETRLTRIVVITSDEHRHLGGPAQTAWAGRVAQTGPAAWRRLDRPRGADWSGATQHTDRGIRRPACCT